MDIYKEMWKLAIDLEKMHKNDNYSVEDFIEALKFQVDQLGFFYDYLVPKQGKSDPGKTFYNL
jgi:hypothetical protein